MKFYAVIDTNIIIAAFLSKKEDTATVKILKELAGGSIVPLYHEKSFRNIKRCCNEINSLLHQKPQQLL